MVDYTEGSGYEYHIQTRPEDVGKYVILPGDPGRCEKIASYLDHPKEIAYNREFKSITGFLMGEQVTVTSTGIGGPSASIAMEELHHCGADTFIRVGTCGGMQEQVMGGDLIIASGAIRMEGASREYAPIEFPAVPHHEVLSALVQAAGQQAIPYHVGVVQCKDSFYGQHEPEVMPVSYDLQSKWDAWCRLGTLGSEMESAAEFIVGSYLGLRVGTVLLVVANQERAKKGLPNPQAHDTDAAIRTAIDAMKLLIQRDRAKMLP